MFTRERANLVDEREARAPLASPDRFYFGYLIGINVRTRLLLSPAAYSFARGTSLWRASNGKIHLERIHPGAGLSSTALDERSIFAP